MPLSLTASLVHDAKVIPRLLLLAAATLLPAAAPVAKAQAIPPRKPSSVRASSPPPMLELSGAARVRAQLLQASGPLPSFEVASIRPTKPGTNDGDFSIRSAAGLIWIRDEPLTRAIMFAYDLKSDDQLLQAPVWIATEHWDIEAKAPQSQVQAMKNLPQPERTEHFRLMMQSLLTERLNLQVKIRTKTMPHYALVAAKKGPRMAAAKSNKRDSLSNDVGGGRGRITAIGVSMDDLARALSHQAETGSRVVVDATGLHGQYDFTLNWTPYDPNDRGASSESVKAPSPDSGPSLFTALEEQLGLKLVSRKGPVQVLVIDHIERPSPN